MTVPSKGKQKFGFTCVNRTVYGYGKDYREAARNVNARGKPIDIGMLVRVLSPSKYGTKVSYLDGREFVKELKKGDKIRSKKK